MLNNTEVCTSWKPDGDTYITVIGIFIGTILGSLAIYYARLNAIILRYPQEVAKVSEPSPTIVI